MIDLLFGFGISVLAVAAALWIIASGGSDRDVMFMLLLSVAALGWTMASAHSQQQAERWMARFPGPVAISAPTWQRVLLCLLMMPFAGVILHGAAFGKTGPGDDWELYRMVTVGILGLVVGIGALCQLERRELVLSLDRLEYRSFWKTYSYRWSELSRFYTGNSRWNYLVCEFAHQSHPLWLLRRGLIIAGPLGVSKRALKTLLVAWQARALSSASAAASRAMGPDSRKRSLLDYA
ncbi:MAG: hypothetical protein AB1440_28830 [Pseudomonadota bacterium]|jgi:hypothetical protein